MEQHTLSLPLQVTGRADVGRLLREVEQIDNFLKQASIREPGTPVKMPKTTRLLDEFAEANNVNLLHDDDRAKALNFLIAIKAKAPVLHMSFSVDPAPVIVQKITKWLRSEIHPAVLLQVGLQPNIGAGCVVRSTNMYFDFSLREHFKKAKPLLLEKLHGEIKAAPEEPVQPEQPETPESPAQPEAPTAPEAPASAQPDEQPSQTPETPAQPEQSHETATPVENKEQEAPHA